MQLELLSYLILLQNKWLVWYDLCDFVILFQRRLPAFNFYEITSRDQMILLAKPNMKLLRIKSQ